MTNTFGHTKMSAPGAALITVVALCLLGVSPAYAQDAGEKDAHRSIYVQVDLGIAPKTHSTLEGVPSGRLDFDGSVFPAALTIGWKPAGLQNDAGGWALELSAFTRRLSIEQTTIGSVKSPSDGDMEVGGFMANVRYELNLGSVRPYLTGGAGVAKTEISDVPDLKLRDTKTNKANFVSHFGAGVGFQPKAFGRASLWLGYDCLTTSTPRFETQYGINPPGTMRVKHVLPETFTLGLRYAF